MAGDEERETGEADELAAFDDGDMAAALDELAPPDEPGRQVPPERQRGSYAMRPRDDTEKTLALEMGRLFGMNPRQLVDPDASARPRRPAEEAEDPEAEGDSVDTA